MTHAITYTTEGGGCVATCTCLWLRWAPTEKDAREYARKHMPKERE